MEKTYYEYLLTLPKEKLTEILKNVESANESVKNFHLECELKKR